MSRSITVLCSRGGKGNLYLPTRQRDPQARRAVVFLDPLYWAQGQFAGPQPVFRDDAVNWRTGSVRWFIQALLATRVRLLSLSPCLLFPLTRVGSHGACAARLMLRHPAAGTALPLRWLGYGVQRCCLPPTAQTARERTQNL